MSVHILSLFFTSVCLFVIFWFRLSFLLPFCMFASFKTPFMQLILIACKLNFRPSELFKQLMKNYVRTEPPLSGTYGFTFVYFLNHAQELFVRDAYVYAT